MNNDLISREALKKAILKHCRSEIEAINHFWYDDTIIALINNAPTASPKEICIANIHFDKEQMQEIVDKAIIRCKDCIHQKKYWHEDKRMKEKGYWVYGCDLIDDSFVGTPVWGLPDQFCSSAESKEE